MIACARVTGPALLLLLGGTGCPSPASSPIDGSASGDDTGTTATPVESPTARLHAAIPSIVYVDWYQTRPTDESWVEYRFEGDSWLATPHQVGDSGAHTQIVLGLPYGVEVEWRVVTGESIAPSGVQNVTTGAAPAGLPTVAVDVADTTRWDAAGKFLLTSVSEVDALGSASPRFWVVLLDRHGRYVWALPADPASWTLYAKPSRDGTTLLYDDDLFWTSFDTNAPSIVHQIRLDGSEVRNWATPGMAHSFDDLAPDTIVWDQTNRGDDRVVVSAGDADPVVLWSCLEWIATSDIARSPDRPSAETCGANAISWNPDRNTYTLSLWTHETVLELDAATAEVLWYADPSGGHGLALGPTDPVWIWQHEAQLLDADHLLLSSGVGPQDERGNFAATAAYEYLIDQANGTMQLVWSYTSEPEWTAVFKGGVRRLGNGNTLHYFGSAGGVKEIEPGGDVVWQVRFLADRGSWTGRSYWLDDLYPFAP